MHTHTHTYTGPPRVILEPRAVPEWARSGEEMTIRHFRMLSLPGLTGCCYYPQWSHTPIGTLRPTRAFKRAWGSEAAEAGGPRSVFNLPGPMAIVPFPPLHPLCHHRLIFCPSVSLLFQACLPFNKVLKHEANFKHVTWWDYSVAHLRHVLGYFAELEAIIVYGTESWRTWIK